MQRRSMVITRRDIVLYFVCVRALKRLDSVEVNYISRFLNCLTIFYQCASFIVDIRVLDIEFQIAVLISTIKMKY